MLTTLPQRPQPTEETPPERPSRRARRSKGRQPLPLVAVGLLGICLGALLVLGGLFVGRQAARSFTRHVAGDSGSPYGVDPEVNAEASSAYCLPLYQGDSSGLTIDFSPHGKEPLTAAELYEQQRSAVVSLTVYAGQSAAHGSGMILTPDGYVLTCAHVVQDTESCTVSLSDGRDLEAELVGMDAQTDLALLKIDAQDLPAVTFADSDQAVIGEAVYAIGDPVRPEFRATLTDGIISGLNRQVSGKNGVMRLIQISAPINSGNSGGPLFNAWGQVLGVVNMKLSRSDIPVSIENMGMAIPSRTVKSVVEELVQNGKVVHAVLGITCQEMDQTRAHMVQVPEGLWITTINSASDVAKHDIQVGDLITAVNGQPVNTVLQFRDATSGRSPGDTVTLTLWRDQALLKELERLKAEADSSAPAEESASTSQEPFEYHFEELGDIEVKLVDSDTLAED